MSNKYSLDFYDPTNQNPPVLKIGVIGFGGGHVQQTGPNGIYYIIGNPDDPHWRPYPKNMWPGAIDIFPTRQPPTNYEWDVNHYRTYIPDNDISSPSRKYATLLTNHIREVRDFAREWDKQRATAHAEQVATELKRRKAQVKEQLRQANVSLRELEKEKTTLKSSYNRYMRVQSRSGLTDQQILDNFKRENPKSLSLQATIDTTRRNIQTATNELRELT